ERLELLADHFTDLSSALLLGAVERGLDTGVDVARSREDAPGGVVDRLGVDVLRRAEHGQTRTLRRTGEGQANGVLAGVAPALLVITDFNVSHGAISLTRRLAGLTDDRLGRVL